MKSSKATPCRTSSRRPIKSPFNGEKLTANLDRGQAMIGISFPSGSFPSSWLYSGRPASSRRVSRAPSPTGMAHFPTNWSQRVGPSSRSPKSSKHKGSPVYPMRATFTSAPEMFTVLTAFLDGSGRCPCWIISVKISRDLEP